MDSVEGASRMTVTRSRQRVPKMAEANQAHSGDAAKTMLSAPINVGRVGAARLKRCVRCAG